MTFIFLNFFLDIWIVPILVSEIPKYLRDRRSRYWENWSTILLSLSTKGHIVTSQQLLCHVTIWWCTSTMKVRYEGKIWRYYMKVLYVLYEGTICTIWRYYMKVRYEGTIWRYYMKVLYVLYEGTIRSYYMKVLYEGKIWRYYTKLLYVLYEDTIWRYYMYYMKVLYEGTIWRYYMKVRHEVTIWRYYMKVLWR